jgi:hypothetical protein
MKELRRSPSDDVRIDVRDRVLLDALVDLLVGARPVVRVDLVEAARTRLANGDQPSAEVLAQHLL